MDFSVSRAKSVQIKSILVATGKLPSSTVVTKNSKLSAAAAAGAFSAYTTGSF